MPRREDLYTHRHKRPVDNCILVHHHSFGLLTRFLSRRGESGFATLYDGGGRRERVVLGPIDRFKHVIRDLDHHACED